MGEDLGAHGAGLQRGGKGVDAAAEAQRAVLRQLPRQVRLRERTRRRRLVRMREGRVAVSEDERGACGG